AGRELPWYQAAKRQQGAQAAFLGVTCRDDGTWTAVAAGDCCLIQRRDDRLVSSFPLVRSGDFSSNPALWATHAVPAQNVAAIHQMSGGWRVGDSLYLMTDALAQWCLREREAKRDPWVWMDGIVSDNDFLRRITLLRENGRLRGDDTTVLHLEFGNLDEESRGHSALADTH
ncbi:MAG: hypothetical protein V4671_17080, partial [Armatimonadota bacterium]